MCLKIVGIYKKYWLNFYSTQDLFCFAIYKIVDSEYSMNIYNSIKIVLEK